MAAKPTHPPSRGGPTQPEHLRENERPHIRLPPPDHHPHAWTDGGYMRRRAKEIDTSWRNKPYGTAAHRKARAEAQRRANETGFDHGIEPSDLFREFRVFMLPMRQNRYGYEVRCEVVMCEDASRCQPGHGPKAAVTLPQFPAVG